MKDIRGVRLRKFKLRKIILGVRMHFRHRYASVSYVGYRLLSDLSVLSNLSQSRGLLVQFTVCEL